MTQRNPKIQAEMETAATKAIDSLARYKFVMFGYHAGQWVLLNRIQGHRDPNPFKDLVIAAQRTRERQGGQSELALQSPVSPILGKHGQVIGVIEKAGEEDYRWRSNVTDDSGTSDSEYRAIMLIAAVNDYEEQHYEP